MARVQHANQSHGSPRDRAVCCKRVKDKILVDCELRNNAVQECPCASEERARAKTTIGLGARQDLRSKKPEQNSI